MEDRFLELSETDMITLVDQTKSENKKKAMVVERTLLSSGLAMSCRSISDLLATKSWFVCQANYDFVLLFNIGKGVQLFLISHYVCITKLVILERGAVPFSLPFLQHHHLHHSYHHRLCQSPLLKVIVFIIIVLSEPVTDSYCHHYHCVFKVSY